MKSIHRLVTCVMLFGTFTANAQVSLTTYYIIPPTSGCNGLWAFGPASDLYGSGDCSGPYTFSMDPSGCAESPWGFPPFWVSGDTCYSALCSMPCDFAVWSSDSPLPCVHCQISLEMTVGNTTGSKALRITPNPVSSDDPYLRVDIGASTKDVCVTDASGRSVYSRSTINGPFLLDLHDLRAGAYVLRAVDEHGDILRARFIIQ